MGADGTLLTVQSATTINYLFAIARNRKQQFLETPKPATEKSGLIKHYRRSFSFLAW